MSGLKPLALLAIACVSLPSAALAQPLVGTLPGSLSVDVHGSANYVIPLAIPPGRSGMQPNLTLNYNSGAGNGALGVGWTVATGLPQAISRGRSIFARDGYVQAAANNEYSRLYLDGRRLVPSSSASTYWKVGNEYYTEVDSFAKIVATSTTGGTHMWEINGFTLTGKDGSTSYFGATNSASFDALVRPGDFGFGLQDPKAWALKRVVDALGNQMELFYNAYSNPPVVFTGEHVLAKIQYTANPAAGIDPKVQVRFLYSPDDIPGSSLRPDVFKLENDGTSEIRRRLEGVEADIQTDTGWQTVRRFHFAFETSPGTGLSRLKSITSDWRASTSAPWQSLPATVLTYDDPAPNTKPLADPVNRATSSSGYDAKLTGTGDFNGDGKTDRLIEGQVLLSDGNTFLSPTTWIDFSQTPSGWANAVKIGDLNGDGKSDLVWIGGGAANTIYAARSTGSGFEPMSGPGGSYVAIAPSQAWFDSSVAGYHPDALAARISLGDFNGDGRTDILLHTVTGLYVALANGTGFNAPVRWGNTSGGDKFGFYWEFTDIWDISTGHIVEEITVIEPIVADFNNDGADDYAWVSRITNSFDDSQRGTLYLSTEFALNLSWSIPRLGSFAGPETIHWQSNDGHNPVVAPEDFILQVLPGDINGDGLTDLLVLGKRDISPGVSRTSWILYKNDVGGFTPINDYMPIEETIGGTVTPTHNITYTQDIQNWVEVAGAASYLDPLYNHRTTEKEQSGGMFLQDINHDGRADYVLGLGPDRGWWVKYGTLDGFLPAQPLWTHEQGDFTQTFGAYTPFTDREGYGGVSLEKIDIDGDGVSDWLLTSHFYYTQTNAHGPVLCKGLGPNWDRLIAVHDGLGSSTQVSYTSVADPAIYTPGAAVSYPIRELRAGHVVSDVYKDTGGGTPAHFSYQYSGNRLDLSGRGSLGFHSFVTLDHQTNLFKYQFLAQSFPMTGLTQREETYRYLGAADFNLITSHDNTVVFDKVTTTGGATLWPFISKAVEYRWEDGAGHLSTGGSNLASDPENLFLQPKPDGAHIIITATSIFDNESIPRLTLPPEVSPYNPSDTNGSGQNTPVGTMTFDTFSGLPGEITYGNLKQLSTDFGGGFSETVVTAYKSPVGALIGLVDSVTSSVTSPGYNTETAPVKRYNYWESTPLVKDESIDADDDALDLTTTYHRDSLGRVYNTEISNNSATGVQAIGTYTVQTVTAFDPRFDVPTVTEDNYGHTTTTVYDPLFGAPLSMTDANGAQTTTQYDALGRTVQVRDELKNLQTNTAFAWDASQSVSPPAEVNGLTVTSAYSVTSTATVQPSVTTWYDRLGRPLRSTKTGFNDQESHADTAYNLLGQVVASSNPFDQWTKITYDPLGRVLTVTAPNGTVTTNTYAGRATSVTVDAPNLGGANPAPETNTTLVDAKGRTVKVWNADNVPTFDNSGNASTAASIEFRLDGFGRMRATALLGQPSQEITAAYDALGHQTALNDPDKGSWSYLNNALGQVVRQTDAKGNVTTSTFDRLGRPLTRVTAGDGATETAGFYYYDTADNAGLHLVAKGDKGWIGVPQREEADTTGAPGFDAPATINLHYYDNKGRSSLELAQLDSQWFYTYSDYDTYSRVNQVRHYWRPAGHELASDAPYLWENFGYTYAYDSRSYLSSITDSATPSRSWWDSPSYDLLDRVTSVRKGSGHYTQRTYRPEDGVLTAVKTGPSAGSSQIQNLSFGFDGLGNLRSRSDGANSETYGYDNLNRLTTRNGVGVTNYALNGNITSKSDVTGASSGNYGYSSTAPHAVTSAWGYTMNYDANGNLQNRSKNGETWSLNWTGFDKPRWMARTNAVTTVGSEFHYNAARSRVMQLEFDATSGNAPSHYTRKRLYGLGSTLEANYTNSAPTGAAPAWLLDTVRIYVPGPDGLIGAREFSPLKPQAQQEKALVYHYDHLGSVQSITPFGSTAVTYAADNNGKTGLFSEDAWGQRRNPLTWSGTPSTTDDGGADSLTPRGFTGHEMLDDLGLVHMNGRIYDPLIGRMLSADIVVQFPGNLQSYNRYSYVRNNPLTAVDPSGFEEAEPEPAEQLAEMAEANYSRALNRANEALANGDRMEYIRIWEKEVRPTARSAGIVLLGDANFQPRSPSYTEFRDGSKSETFEDKLAFAARAAEYETRRVFETTPGGKRVEDAKPEVKPGDKVDVGRTGRQERLREAGKDPNVSSADRGWIKQEENSIARDQRDTIRNPPGKDLAHERGREAAKGFSYQFSNLQDRVLHRIQHMFDNFGRANKLRPPETPPPPEPPPPAIPKEKKPNEN